MVVDGELYKDMEDSLRNLSKLFDNPIARRALDNDYMTEARKKARLTIEKLDLQRKGKGES